jgi:3-phosphoshikimate 1-carboxyvinyltransferase
MNIVVSPGPVSGTVSAPPSKSHTVRALLIASLADGESVVHRPLDSADARSCVSVCSALGAQVHLTEDADGRLESARIRGVSGTPRPPEDVLDTGNSGTTLYLALSATALIDGWSVFTGDAQIRRRSAENLLKALEDLGARAFSTRSNGCAPLCIRGPLAGGKTRIECPTSQYLSSLLLALPLADGPTELDVPLLYEQPYAEMTLWWLERQGIKLERRGLEWFRIPGGARYRCFESAVPGDYSSATFWFCAAAITASRLRVEGLSPDDPQGDRRVLDILREMGCTITDSRFGVQDRNRTGAGEGSYVIEIEGPDTLAGGEFDLNDIPDALPALAVTASYAQGETRLANVPQARMKETDRIAVMARELSHLGIPVEELPDGLVIKPGGKGPGRLDSGVVSGHQDHRVVMAFAVGALGADGPIEISGAEAAGVTYPDFFSVLETLRSG